MLKGVNDCDNNENIKSKVAEQIVKMKTWLD
jgi:hypothetical protein